MNGFENIAGLVLVIICAGLMLVFSFRARSGAKPALRPIPVFQHLRRALGLAVEEGKRLHVSLGKGNLISPSGAPALVGLATLERVSQISVVSDRPPIATSGDPSVAILSQDTLRAAYRLSNTMEQYDPDRGRLTGPTPFSYIAGAIPVMKSEQVSAHLLVGNFGPEVGLLTEAAYREGAFVLAATDSLPAQAVLYASSSETLVGEELFAVPAYLQAGPLHQASLHTQDVLRWAVIVLLLGGAVLRWVGVL